MIKLRIYIKDTPIFTMLVSSHLTLRQLIAKISVKYNELINGEGIPRVNEIILPLRLKNFYPVFNDENGQKLFAGNFFTRMDLNACITKAMGLNLKDNDAIYINDDNMDSQYNLSFIFHPGYSWKPFFDRDGIGRKEFFEAAKFGDIVTIEELLSLNLSYLTFDLSHALYVAVEHRQYDAVKQLLFAGAKCTRRNDALLLSIKRNYVDMVDLLLIHNAATLNPDSKYETQLLMRSVHSVTMAKYLLSNGLIPRTLNSQVFYTQHYIANFYETAMNGIYPASIQKNIIQYVLPDVADPQFKFESLIDFVFAYYLSILKEFSCFQNKNEREIIKKIFNEVNFTLPPRKFKQQLQIGLSKLISIPPRVMDGMQILLSQLGEDEEKPNHTMIAPHPMLSDEIETKGHDSDNIVEYCLHHYDAYTLKSKLRIIDHIDSTWIVKALKIEAERSRNGIYDEEHISEILLKKKFGAVTYAVKLRARDKSLHEAIIKNDIEKTKLLIEQGATLDNSIYYDYHSTPVHLAIRHDNLTLLQFFIEKNADLHVKDQNNRTPFEFAYQRNIYPMIVLLIQNGAYQAEFKSLFPVFLTHYVKQFFQFILEDVMPKDTPLTLIHEVLQYILDENDFENVTEFLREVKQFYRKEFQHEDVTKDTVLPPMAARNFLLFKNPHLISSERHCEERSDVAIQTRA